MLSLFDLEGSRAKPTAHALLVEPFKSLWERDETIEKAQAILDFTFIEFMVSPLKSNPFGGYGEEERAQKILNDFGEASEYSPDNLTFEGIVRLKELMYEGSYSMRFLNSARIAAEKVEDFLLNTVDLTERTHNGTPVYKPQDVTRTIREINDAIKSINDMEKRVIQELYEAEKTRNNAVINPMEE